ncbi:M24 family metallopeptidase [Halanaerobacter jeridensis]|uniref:Xaa-Pro aminopeptidase n=1 Tax=Halanaerobacter jeridensis TaxID=706427 RepID=A0A938XQ52_9FIRM|nr:Xaa-Pro peptidase family protein [Halanaerobacter jeridensis]MBM7555213.1 Xaa-Pro aminopeptidase [Halanaerobacter jeridensis]
MKERIKKLRSKLDEEEVNALLINNPQNRQYLTAFTGTAGVVLISDNSAKLITDFRYTEQAEDEATDFEIVEQGDNKLETINRLLQEEGIEKLGIEAQGISYRKYLQYQKELDVELVATTDVVKSLRKVKDKSEIDKISQAVEISDYAFEQIQEQLQVGAIEREIALELEFAQKKQGATKNAFDFIVASGTRGAMPHGVASDKEIEAGDLVTMDFGCVYQGYHSDMTRTVMVGEEPTAKQEKIYNLVLEAQQAAIAAIEPGETGAEVDKVARDIIAEAGYGANFGHGLGHSVGLEIHENPRLSRKDDTVLEAGMVVTVEPGVYIPDWGGVRIEDIVVVTDDGCEILTDSPKELLVLD